MSHGSPISLRLVALVVAVHLSVPGEAAAQPAGGHPAMGGPELAFVHESWTVRDGLPLNSIQALLQSRDGYIWIATLDGLVRFDGVRFTVFNTSNSPGLPSNRVISLVEDRDGSLWMRTETADLVRFRDGRFARFGAERGFAGRLYGVSLDTEGAVWIRMVDGLGRIDGERFIPVAEEAIRGAVWGLVRRRDGSVWVSTGPTGFFRIEGGRTERIVTGTALDSTLIIGMAEDSAGVLWLYTQNDVWEEVESGLRQLGSTEPGSAIRAGFRPRPHTRLVLAGRRAYPIEAYPGQAPQEHWIAGAVDAEGALWYVAGSRLYRQGALAWDLGRVLGRTGEDVELTAIAIDREGSIWLGTFNAGLHRLKPALFATYSQPEGVANARVTTVYEDRSGAIWAGTWGGLSRIDGHGRVETWTTLAGRRAVFSLSSDRPDRLWVGTDAGLLSCSLPAVDCRSVDAPAALRGHIYALYSDTRGRLWVGAGSGVVRLEDGHWIMLDSKPGTAPVRAFAETADGALWMGTNGDGLIRYAHGRYTRIDQSDGLPSDLVRALHVDAEGWLWVGTEGRGLARLDPRAWADGAGGAGGADIAASRRIVHVGVEHGLYDPVIHQILEDDAGRLWMSTNRGIFWVPRAELHAFADGRAARVHSTHYTERDGMRNREANGGSQPAGVRARDGRLWFPTQDGVVVIDPARVAVARVPSPPVVERVVAGDSSYVPGEGAIRLGVDERDVEIEYTAPSFLEPANIRFRYRLDPYDADWVDAGRRRSAFYTRLPPGRYSFTVSASSHGGVWSDVGAPLELVVTPRFHETRAARLLLVVTLMLLAAGGVQWRLRSLRRRERELTRLVDERTAELRRNEVQLAAQNAELAEQAERLAELDQLKSRLFANISHEFRTPLTLILGPLRSMLDGRHGALPPAVREQAQVMLRNGQRLLRLINQLLDLTRLQAGQLTLRRRTHDLVSFTRGITLAFAPLAERREITLGFQTRLPALPFEFDAEQLEKVLLNLLSNALKFTPAGGVVEVSVDAESEAAVIAVRDTGIGIAPEDLPRVFQRFYQSDTSATRRYEGTGIGLALARELVELHGGEIRAESTLGVGSTFTLRLPLAHGGLRPAREGAQIEGEATSSAAASHAHFAVPDAATLAATLPEPEPSSPREADDLGGDAPEPDAQDEDRTTILIVDDNADVRAYIRSVLAPSYRVLEAADGRAGLERARAELPDLIVADVMMPELDGLALGRALKDDPMTDSIPVILLTARAAPEDQIAGFETGADAYVVKPFDPGVLEAQVAALIAQRRRLRERFRTGESMPPVPAPAPRSELEQRLRPIVEANLMEPGFGPETLAAAAGLSYHQLYRALRQEMATTPTRFIRTVRVEYAAELLRQGAGSVTEIAYSVGFESLSYFRRAFRERFGTTPAEHLPAGRSTPEH